MSGNLSFLLPLAEGAASGVGEVLSSKVLDYVLSQMKRKFGNKLLFSKEMYRRYLENAFQRYDTVKTLANSTTPRKMTGENSIYVNVSVRYQNRTYTTVTVDNLIGVNNNVVIVGGAGMGKSTLIRHLFLNTISREEYIPIWVDLRKASAQTSTGNSISDLVYSSFCSFDGEAYREQFEYSLRLGKHILFLDGLDEVKTAIISDIAASIQEFASKYPENAVIVTARPDSERKYLPALETFTQFQMMPLTKHQAKMLSQKLMPENKKQVDVFCKELDEKLFSQYLYFAQNPLLLTMMLITYIHNRAIPEKPSEFYDKCFDALFEKHDKENKSSFKREFQSRINKFEFKRIFAIFCYGTYFSDEFEFSEERIRNLLSECIDRLGFVNLQTEGFLNDLCNNVCMLVQEGDWYHFTHRSFQTYFAAVHTIGMTPDRQSKRFAAILSQPKLESQYNFFRMVWEMSPRELINNGLLIPFSSIAAKMQEIAEPQKWAFWEGFRNAAVDLRVEEMNHIAFAVYINGNNDQTSHEKILRLVYELLGRNAASMLSPDEMLELNILLKKCNREVIVFKDIPSIEGLTFSENKQIIHLLIKHVAVPRILGIIRNSIAQDDGDRKKPISDSIFD